MKRQFLKQFKTLTYRTHNWQVWSDFVTMAACAIANRVDSKSFEKREKLYLELIERYDEKEQNGFAKLLAITIQALEENPEQDFLGELFQELELSSHWQGQFFTPYHLCEVMAQMQTQDFERIIDEKGYVTINDPACGAGATLIAFANVARKRKVNYQNHILFIAQDIDHTAAMMCYIQLSLLGCPGYVIVGDTLAKPGLHPNNDVWYTPMYFSDVWHWRRVWRKMDGLIALSPLSARVERIKQTPAKVQPAEGVKPLQLTLW